MHALMIVTRGSSMTNKAAISIRETTCDWN